MYFTWGSVKNQYSNMNLNSMEYINKRKKSPRKSTQEYMFNIRMCTKDSRKKSSAVFVVAMLQHSTDRFKLLLSK